MVSGGFCFCRSCPAFASIFLTRESWKPLCEFSFHNVKKERCSESPDLTDGRTVSLPNPHATAGGIAIGHPVFHIHLTSVTLIIPTMSGFIVLAYLSQNLPSNCEMWTFICMWISLLLLPQYRDQITSFPTVMSVCLLHFLVLGLCGMPFLFGLALQQHLISLCEVNE